MPKTDGLTPRQQRFVDEYLIDLNATQAAIRAGYAENSARVTAARLLTKADICAAVSEAQNKRAAKLELTHEWVLSKLVENLNRAMQAEPVLNSAGMPTGEYTYQGTVANRALELIGKHLGSFPDRHEHRFDPHDLDKLGPHELIAIAARLEQNAVH